MKTIFLILTLFFITSCDKNDETSQETTDLIDGWKLIKFEAGFGPTLIYDGEIIWTFNSDNTINVVIIDGTEVYDSLPFNELGIYEFSINSNSIFLDNVTYKLEITNNELIISDLIGQAADGRKLTFSRIEN